ncbi:MAG: hypothetical protein A2857_06790 [Candidatus Levybacteria bacterium RIFCSPHIGHO2_01_FULL_36_15]|nr:MAG: hypothetical protein A2857_06790 [Candidatus Levybacteria bacterium RIFCSPHIGHO2_01_FULL_36_15]OGH37802.1 MAG: hypothetical protein A2905_00115 [Candidatus Levybacteria bacterium RIFCSPLOWO2_01_FULL_36_10]
MENKDKKRVILGVAAHPDDLEFGASGTFAKWAQTGAECYYLICADGSKGSGDPNITPEKLIRIRQKEQIDAGKILGLKNVFFLDYPDTELVPNLDVKRDIVRYIRMLKPDTVVTLDPTMVYSISRNSVNHTDHRAVGIAAMDAVFPLARDRLTFPEQEVEGLSPHKVKYLYFVNFDNYNEIVDITPSFDIKIKALTAHKSQIKDEHVKITTERAMELGKKNGVKYAEGFVKITLR